MPLQNAFAVGPCVATVVKGDPPTTTVFSGAIAAGQTIPFTDPLYGAMAVAVDVNGRASLLNNSGIGLEDPFALQIVPQYSLAQATGAQLDNAASASAEGFAYTNDTNAATSLQLPTLPQATVDLSALTPINYLALGMHGGLSAAVEVLAFTPMLNMPAGVSYNCDCDDNTNRTLADLRAELAMRLGFAANIDDGSGVVTWPQGMKALLSSFLIGAQKYLFRRYDVLRTERFFTWTMTQGVRYYDLPGLDTSECAKKLDPRKVTWVGVQHANVWYELHAGIAPQLYSLQVQGFPTRYEIRQCIEVWPAPSDSDFKLRIKGRFELEPFAADTDKATLDDELILLLALANAKAHYGQPDASLYLQQFEQTMMKLVAGAHQTRRYVAGKLQRFIDPDPLYIPLAGP